MAELVNVTLIDGETRVINLDYVMQILPSGEDTSNIVMTEGAPFLVNGVPAQIAMAPRLREGEGGGL
jgi:hypothetical protein